MGRDIRMIATDLDGTLLAGNGHVSDRTVSALRRAHAAGIVVVAATGRSHRTAVPRLAPVGVVDWAVCSNGAVLFDLVGAEEVERHPIDDALLPPIFIDVQANLPQASFAWEMLDGLHYEEGFLAVSPMLDPDAQPWTPVPIDTRRHARSVSKLMITHPRLAADALLDALAPLLPSGVTPSASGMTFIEITKAGVDKAFGLDRLCARLSISADEVMAFGDHLNDLAMLRWAGRGVASVCSRQRRGSCRVTRP